MIIVAGQDMAAMQKTSPQIAETAAANASILAVGKTVDGDKTIKFVQSVFGRTQVSVTSGYTSVPGLFSNRWVDRMDASIQEVDKVRIDELQHMMEGEFYFLFNGTLVKSVTFYIGGDFAEQFAVNKFIKVRGPTDRVPGLDQSRETEFLQSFMGASRAISALAKAPLEFSSDPAADAPGRLVRSMSEHARPVASSRSAMGQEMLLSWRDAILELAPRSGSAGSSGHDPYDDILDDLEEDMDRDDHGALDMTLDDDLGDIVFAGEDPPGERLARGLERVATGARTEERAGGMIDILVSQEAAQKEVRKGSPIDRYRSDVTQRLHSEMISRVQTFQDVFSSIAETSERLSRLIAEENVQGSVAVKILRNAQAHFPLPLNPIKDEERFTGTMTELEKVFARKMEESR